MSVRGSPPTNVAIVTQLVTRGRSRDLQVRGVIREAIVTVVTSAPGITCINTRARTGALRVRPTYIPRPAGCSCSSCPPRGCHPLSRGCCVRASGATAQQFGPDSVDSVKIFSERKRITSAVQALGVDAERHALNPTELWEHARGAATRST